MKTLENFHLRCKKEYNEMIREFNILFYGYGCKEYILSKIFPNTPIFNCNYMNKNDLCDELLGILKKQKINIKDVCKLKYPEVIDGINILLEKYGKYIQIIILNFDFNSLEGFIGKTHIRIIGTLENVKSNITFSHIMDFNFIFRDLTTYRPYLNEIADIKIEETNKSTQNIINVLNSVSKKSRNIFKLLLESFIDLEAIPLKDIFKIVKKNFLINNYGIFSNLLLEFFDHNILKRDDCENIYINLTVENRKKILENWNYD
ncbi:Origin recognition complex subunit 2 [Astathelohania contejeani]|uniref:Origin recognition complex subunit 2 n=1 Tax=Astathelohania contejeani TaxID=164912 RepID=A0ABQ7I2N9_9MICR|nr:Origin recognition complex subunit 2 [Thelohania contejeani]